MRREAHMHLALPLMALLLASLSGGCAFTDRWDRPDPEEHPREAIADVFRYGLLAHPDDPRSEEARIVTVTAERIVWEPLDAMDGELSRRALRFADIAAVAYHEEQVFSRGVDQEAVFVYVRGDPRVVAASGAVFQLPGEADVPLLGRPYISLRRRAPGSCHRLTKALATLGFRY